MTSWNVFSSALNWLLCFSRQVSINFKDIESLTKEKTVKVIPNAIQFQTKSHKYTFTSFTARDKVFQQLFKLWEDARQNKVSKNLNHPVLKKAQRVNCASVAFAVWSPLTPSLPNLFSVAGHFHMRKFIAGHTRFCDVTISCCGGNESYSCTQCCQLVWM